MLDTDDFATSAASPARFLLTGPAASLGGVELRLGDDGQGADLRLVVSEVLGKRGRTGLSLRQGTVRNCCLWGAGH